MNPLFFWWAGSNGSTPAEPRIIDIVGSYIPTITVTGEYRTTVDVEGQYVPTIDIIGSALGEID